MSLSACSSASTSSAFGASADGRHPVDPARLPPLGPPPCRYPPGSSASSGAPAGMAGVRDDTSSSRTRHAATDDDTRFAYSAPPPAPSHLTRSDHHSTHPAPSTGTPTLSTGKRPRPSSSPASASPDPSPSPDLPDPHPAKSRRKVCDCCRTRKLRCSRSLPCTSCEAHGWACSYGGGAAPLPFLALAGGGAAGEGAGAGEALAASRAELMRLQRVVELLKGKWEREQARIGRVEATPVTRATAARPAHLRLALAAETQPVGLASPAAPGTPATYETAHMLLSLSHHPVAPSTSSSGDSRSPDSRGSTPPSSADASPHSQDTHPGATKLSLPPISSLISISAPSQMSLGGIRLRAQMDDARDRSVSPFNLGGPRRAGGESVVLPPLKSVFGVGSGRAMVA